jgi:hypothetical protein
MSGVPAPRSAVEAGVEQSAVLVEEGVELGSERLAEDVGG